MFRKTQKIILLIDTSGSMNGTPINDIKKAVNTLSQSLTKYNSSKTKVSLQIITFNEESKFISKNRVQELNAQGQTNLSLAYENLNLIFKRNSTFDYPPIIMLFCDGHPNQGNHKWPLWKLYKDKNFQKSRRFAFAYGEQDEKTMRVLSSFTGITNNIFTSNDSNLLKLLIEKTIPKVIKMQRVHASTSNKVMSKTIYKDIKRFSNKKLRGYYGY